jgi:uncharacterized alpha-E superfamily protein
MLSRVADSIYWMSRYVERAENVARFIDVNLNLMLDGPVGVAQQWQPLVNTTGDHEIFARRFGKATQQNTVFFLTFDPENVNSILSCLRGARENARSIREIISSEMWEQLNTFYLTVQEASEHAGAPEKPHQFYTEVKQASHLFNGVTDATMARNEAWHFLEMGRMLERADKTSRILDMKYYILLRSLADVGTPFDEIHWAAVLRSASAFEMYRKRHGRIVPGGIMQFLLFDPEFPRSVRFCLNSARNSLHAITGTPLGSFRNSSERLLGQLCSDLAFTNADEVSETGLHEYLDDLQSKMNQLSTGIYETFFALKTPKVTRRAAQVQTQTQ